MRLVPEVSFVRDQRVIDMVAGERKQAEEELNRLRRISDRERGAMILSACRTAKMIHDGRLKSGLEPASPDPWPSSTWEFLHKCAAHVERK
jgi:hypothetical protein